MCFHGRVVYRRKKSKALLLPVRFLLSVTAFWPWGKFTPNRNGCEIAAYFSSALDAWIKEKMWSLELLV